MLRIPIRALWTKLNRGAKIGAIVGALGILPFASYTAIGLGYLARRSASATLGSFLAWGITGLVFALAWLALLSGSAVIVGALGTFVWKLVGPLPTTFDP